MSRLLELCQELPVWSYEPGDAVLREDRKDGRLYVLKAGTVEVRKRDQPVMLATTPGAVFGEVAVLLRCAHSATVVAVEPAEFYVAEDGESFLHDHAELNLHLARLLAFRLQRITEQLVELQEAAESSGWSPSPRFHGVLRSLADQF
jgi:CRP-like cAMP-binding protein